MRRNPNPFVKYIGISAINSGKRSGKDTFAAYLIDELEGIGHIAEKRALADSLKVACGEIFNLSHEQMHGTTEQKDSLTAFDWPQGNPLGRSGKMKAREILQYFGSEVMRNGFDTNVWVNSLYLYGEKRLKEVMPLFNAGLKRQPLYIIVPDIRFPNEADFVDYLVDIYRPEAEENNQDVHISEKAGKEFTREIDLQVGNFGLKEELKDSAKNMIDILKVR